MSIIVDALKITPAAVLTSTAASQVVQTTAGSNLLLNAPGSNRLANEVFYVEAVGYAFSGAGTYTATVQPILYGDVSLATVTTKPLFTSTAGTLAYTGTVGASIPWYMFAEISGNGSTTTAPAEGQAWSTVNATLKAQTALTPSVTAVNWQTEPPFKFAIGNTCGGTVGASFKFVVTNFRIIQE